MGLKFNLKLRIQSLQFGSLLPLLTNLQMLLLVPDMRNTEREMMIYIEDVGRAKSQKYKMVSSVLCRR